MQCLKRVYDIKVELIRANKTHTTEQVSEGLSDYSVPTVKGDGGTHTPVIDGYKCEPISCVYTGVQPATWEVNQEVRWPRCYSETPPGVARTLKRDTNAVETSMYEFDVAPPPPGFDNRCEPTMHHRLFQQTGCPNVQHEIQNARMPTLMLMLIFAAGCKAWKP